MPIFICFKIHSFNLSSFFNLLEKKLVRLRHRKVFNHSFFAQTVDNIYFTVIWVRVKYWAPIVFCLSNSSRTSKIDLYKVKTLHTLYCPRRDFAVPRKQCSSSRVYQGKYLHVQLKCRKIPKISPEAYIFQRPSLRGFFFWGGELIFGEAYVLRGICVSKSIGLAYSYGRKFTVFLLFYSVFEGIFQVRAPGGLYSEGRFLQYEFGRLTFGGA